MNKETAAMVNMPVTKFKESNALRINRKIKPELKNKEKDFLNRILNVSINAKIKVPKNKTICIKFAWVRLFG